MQEELKPCPFCGGKAHLLQHISNYKRVYYQIICLQRGNGTAYYKGKKTVKAKWNKRT